MAKDLTTQVLIQIRDEITGVRDEVSGVRGEVRELRTDVGGLRGEVRELRETVVHLEKRQTETEVRLATELVAVAAAVHLVRDELRATRTLNGQVNDHERRIRKLEKQTG